MDGRMKHFGAVLSGVLVILSLLFVGCKNPLLNTVQDLYQHAQSMKVPPIPPDNLNPATETDTSVRVSWESVSNALSYALYCCVDDSDGLYISIYQGSSPQYLHDSLSDGSIYYYKVEAFNDAGASGMSDYVSVVIDLTPPNVAVTSPADSAILSDSTPLISGTASDATSSIRDVYVQIDTGVFVEAATSNGWATWSYTPPALAAGEHTATARATDGGGMQSTDSVVFTVDAVDPSVSINSPADGSLLSGATPTISGTASDTNGISKVEVKIDATGYATASGTTSWSYTSPSSLSDGPHTIYARATDGAGRQTAEPVPDISITVDTTDPSVGISSPGNNSTTTDTTPAITGTAWDANGIQKVEVQVDGGSFYTASGTSSWSYTTGALSAGAHTITARSTDNVNRTKTASITLNVLVPPTGVSATDGSYGDKVEITWNSVPGASQYYVYRPSGTLLGSTNLTSWDDTTGTPMTNYTYTVRAYRDSVYSGYSTGDTGYRVGYYEYVSQWGSSGTGNGQFNRPSGIAIYENYVFVADTWNDRIQRFSRDGVYQTKWGSSGTGNGQFDRPFGISASGGYVFVSDTLNNRIQRFNSSGSYQLQWGSAGSGDGQFNEPYGVVCTSSGAVYVGDVVNNRIQQFYYGGGFVRKWGSEGTGNTQFKWPYGVASRGSYVYVADYNNHCIKRFNTSGGYQLTFGTGLFGSPFGITTDSSGYVYVTDIMYHRVRKFTADGTLLLTFGSSGTGNGQLNTPNGIAVDSDGYVYIADSNNHRIQKFQLK